MSRTTVQGFGLPASWLPNVRDGLKKTVLGGTALIGIYLAVSPFVFMIWTAFWSSRAGDFSGHFTLDNFIMLYTNPYTYQLFLNTFIVAFGMLVGVMILGVGFAWLFARTNIPTKGWAETVLLSPYAVSGYVYAIMFAFLLGPDMGFVNNQLASMFGISEPLFNIFSVWGIFLVLIIDNVTTVYLLVVPALRNMDPALEEVARVHGANVRQTVLEVSLPVVKPAISGAALITFLKGLGLFSIIAILGLPFKFFVVTTQIWVVNNRGLSEGHGFSSALAVTLLVITGILIWYHRRITKRKEDFMTITGSGFQPRQWDLGRLRWPLASVMWVFLLGLWGIPVLSLVVVSLHPVWIGELMLDQLTFTHYQTLFQRDMFIRAMKNTAILAIAGGLIATFFITLLVYYIERTKMRGRGLVDFLSLTPKAAPGVVMGLSLLFTYLFVGRVTGVYITGTLAIITLGLVTNSMATMTRMAAGSIVQIHDELEESARIAGASWLQMMREVFLPLYKGTLGVLFLYAAIHFAKNVSIPIMLYSTGSETVSVMIFQFWAMSANFEVVAAFATLAVGVILAVLLAVRLFGIKFYEIA